MSVESDQLVCIAELCQRFGVLFHHCGDSRRCIGDAGLPDVLMVGVGGVLYRELKSSPRGVTAAQTTWRWALTAAGADAGLWLPSHIRNGTAEAQIAALAHAG